MTSDEHARRTSHDSDSVPASVLESLIESWRDGSDSTLRTDEAIRSATFELCANRLELVVRAYTEESKSEGEISNNGMVCHECGKEHHDWEKDGEFTVDDKHNAGTIVRWECGNCGGIEEVPIP